MTNFVKFFLATLVAFLLDYCLAASLLYFKIHYFVAVLAGVCLGTVTGFLLVNYWIYPTTQNSIQSKRAIGYALGVLLIYCIRTLFMKVCYGYHPEAVFEYVFLFLAYVLSFIFNFLYQKFIFTKLFK